MNEQRSKAEQGQWQRHLDLLIFMNIILIIMIMIIFMIIVLPLIIIVILSSFEDVGPCPWHRDCERHCTYSKPPIPHRYIFIDISIYIYIYICLHIYIYMDI